ncbi:hypothetical protein BDP81DRAFT_446965 [Colletotrichum phormii]|uniref:Uncharacterized protein n=1 Tax=Colletotrichum phormii TaxID=359342 RepID=A0AAJ0ELA5_9PEZI|nr:uncharacterized protein BDP81DRAFT_446965 [Colletotrichum phormii]KAK1640720.1 hypothetical protein BDP81DRAFT_446965 [Colletotrichum phormii]
MRNARTGRMKTENFMIVILLGLEGVVPSYPEVVRILPLDSYPEKIMISPDVEEAKSGSLAASALQHLAAHVKRAASPAVKTYVAVKLQPRYCNSPHHFQAEAESPEMMRYLYSTSLVLESPTSERVLRLAAGNLDLYNSLFAQLDPRSHEVV